jgi:branched-subunit amino acid ABC-type transport system permease component
MIDVTLAVLILVFLFFRFTPLGLALRAAARNPVSSRLVGIRVGRMLAFGWGLVGRCNWSGGRNDGGADRLSRPRYDERHSGN